MKTVAGMKVGDTFGMLTLVSVEGASKKNGYKCVFECACGKVKKIKASNVKAGFTKSCGCARWEARPNFAQSKTKQYKSWGYLADKGKLSLKEFVDIFKGIEDPDNRITPIGVMPSKTAIPINRNGCAQYPAIFCCVFILGGDSHLEATRKTGFSKSFAYASAKQHPDVYAAGLQARTEREAASKPAPPSLPVNMSVDF